MSIARLSSVTGSPGERRICTPALMASPRTTDHQIHRSISTMISAFGGNVSGKIMTMAAGMPMAAPRAPILRTRWRYWLPKMKAIRKQRRSQGISNEISQANRAKTRPMVTPSALMIDPMIVAAVSSRATAYITIITRTPSGIWCCRIGIVAAMHATTSRKVALPLPAVGVSSRRRESNSELRFIGRRRASSRALSLPPRRRCEKSRPDSLP